MHGFVNATLDNNASTQLHIHTSGGMINFRNRDYIFIEKKMQTGKKRTKRNKDNVYGKKSNSSLSLIRR